MDGKNAPHIRTPGCRRGLSMDIDYELGARRDIYLDAKQISKKKDFLRLPKTEIASE
jgi:hypothetical protein